jgi:hypothetical protein
VLDNHTVELGTQDKNFALQVARRAEEESRLYHFPRVLYKPSIHPCGEKKLATILCTWSPTEVVHTGSLPSMSLEAIVDI